jgi:hypothetical protein
VIAFCSKLLRVRLLASVNYSLVSVSVPGGIPQTPGLGLLETPSRPFDAMVKEVGVKRENGRLASLGTARLD